LTSTIADQPPAEPSVTDYDRAHLKLYLRLLDADAERASWEEVSRLLLDIDPARGRERARLRYESHLARARWMTDQGYLDLLKSGRS
jgi:type VI secretion system activator RovC-like protein